jgi:drug/metabolite transporter (DMT)-like permease
MSARTRFWITVGSHTLLAAGTYLLGKVATASIPVLALGFLRFSIAGLGFLLLARFGALGLRRAWAEDRRSYLLAGFLGVLVNQVAFLWGLKLTLPAHASLLYALTPTVVLLLAWLRGQERPTARKLLGLALAFGGVLVLFLGGRTAGLPPRWLLGDALIVVAVLAWAGYTVVSRPLVLRHGSRTATAVTILTGTVLFLPVGVFGLPALHPAAVPTAAWIGVLYMGLVSSVVMYLLWFHALSLREPSRVAIASNLQPLLTAVLAWALLGQPITAQFGLGAVLVLAGVLITQY